MDIPFVRILFVVCALNSTYIFAGDSVDSASKNMAYCGHVHAYAVNYFLIQNNIGAARSMILQQARSQTALFALNYVDGTIPGDKIREFKSIGRQSKKILDDNPGQILATIDSCVSAVNDTIASHKLTRTQMWGRSFTEIVEATAVKLRAHLGL
jgi:hypothetical protein